MHSILPIIILIYVRARSIAYARRLIMHFKYRKYLQTCKINNYFEKKIDRKSHANAHISVNKVINFPQKLGICVRYTFVHGIITAAVNSGY